MCIILKEKFCNNKYTKKIESCFISHYCFNETIQNARNYMAYKAIYSITLVLHHVLNVLTKR